MTPYDYKNEAGVSDATYQDFVAPMLMGLGIGPKILSRTAPTIAGALGVAAPQVESETEEAPVPITTLEDVVSKFQDVAQKAGDWARVMKYKALRSMMGESQMTPNDVLDTLNKIHADTR